MFLLRIIKILIFCLARCIHLSASVAHGDAVANNHHRDNANRQPDIFGIVKKKSIAETSGGKAIEMFF